MAQYVAFGRVMEQVIDDSDWCDSNDDLVEDELEDRLERHSSLLMDEDPLDRIETSPDDDTMVESTMEEPCLTSDDISDDFLPSANDPFLLVPGPRRSVLVDLNADI